MEYLRQWYTKAFNYQNTKSTFPRFKWSASRRLSAFIFYTGHSRTSDWLKKASKHKANRNGAITSSTWFEGNAFGVAVSASNKMTSSIPRTIGNSASTLFVLSFFIYSSDIQTRKVLRPESKQNDLDSQMKRNGRRRELGTVSTASAFSFLFVFGFFSCFVSGTLQ